jgi:SOS response regulatory protein OraA/RecX
MEFLNIDNAWLIIKLLSIPAALKMYILIQSLRMYGVYNLYKHKDIIFNHNIFTKLDRLYTDQELFNKIADTARREIFKDVFKIDIQSLNEILLSFRDIIYREETFIGFMRYHRYLDSKHLMELFLRLHNAHRDKLEKQIRMKLKRGGLDNQRIIFITQKFYEFTEENSFMFREKLEILKKRNNLYYVIIDLLDRIEIEIESEKKFLPMKFMKLNGKLDNLIYKGYESFQESNAKIKIIPEVNSNGIT